MSEKENMDLDLELEADEALAEEALEASAPAAVSEKSSKSAKSDSGKKNKPAEKKKSGNGIGRFLREMKSELKKVAWPTRAQTTKNTGVVITCVIIVGAFVWFFDGVIVQVISALIKLVSSFFGAA